MAPETANQLQRAASFLDDRAALAPWLLRLAFGAVFMFHGIQKVDGGVSGFAEMMGLSTGLAWLVVVFEIATGALVVLGGFRVPNATLITRIGGALAVPVMVGAITKAHWGRWSFTPAEGFPMGGMEFQILLIALGLWFVITGGRPART